MVLETVENRQVVIYTLLCASSAPWRQELTARTELAEKFESLGWQERKRIAEGALQTNSPSQWARMTGGLVAQRNRYMNVDPFAANRVQLKVPEGHDDYINASPIIIRSSKTGVAKNYIATQVRWGR